VKKNQRGRSKEKKESSWEAKGDEEPSPQRGGDSKPGAEKSKKPGDLPQRRPLHLVMRKLKKD